MAVDTYTAPGIGTFQYNPDSGIALPKGAQLVSSDASSAPTQSNSTPSSSGSTNYSNPYSSPSSSGGSSSSSSNYGNAPTAPTDPTASNKPSWMGDAYKQDSSGYWSTNPGNPNAERFYSDGRPVPTVGLDDNANNVHYNGYATPEQFQQLQNSAYNPQAETALIEQWLKSGQLNSPINTNPSGSMLSSATANSSSPVKDTLTKLGYGYPNNVNDPNFLNKSPQERLQAFATGNADPYAELNRVKAAYAATTDPARQQQIHAWADQVRQAAGISANDPFFGNGAAPTSQGSLNTTVNGQNAAPVNVYNGTSYETADQLQKDLGVKLTIDSKTGVPSFNGVPIYTYSKDANGNIIVPTRMVANALGYQVNYDPKSGSVQIQGQQPGAGTGTNQPGNGMTQGQDFGFGGNQFGNGSGYGMQQDPTAAWNNYISTHQFQQPTNLMPIQQQFDHTVNDYYDQAHKQIDPLYNTQYDKLMSLRDQNLTKMDESMNRRGIYTSGLAEAAANDLRAKTNNSVSALFSKQMSDVEKTAQTLYNDAYKQYYQGNQFALKNNQDQMNNYMNQQKQIFAQWLGTQKLSLQQAQYALNSWDKHATMLWNQYKFDNLSADQKANLDWKQTTFDNLSADQQANLDQAWQKAMIPYNYGPTPYQQDTLQQGQQKIDIQQAAQQLQAYFKQLGYNLDVSKLQEAIRHDQATEGLAAQKLTVDMANNQQNFAEKVRMDNDNIVKANAQLQDTAKRTQLDGLKSELNSTAQRINTFVSNNQQVPQTLVDSYNQIKGSVDNVIASAGISTNTGTSDGNFDAYNQF